MTRGWQAKLAARAAVLVLAVAVAWIAREQLMKEDPRDRRIAQRIRLLDAPKLPPPPKIEEKPVEVKPEKEIELQRELPRDAPGPKDPGDRLGLDEEGTGGGDAFGLESRRGGRDITTIGTAKPPGSPGPAGWSWYGGLIRRHLEEIARAEKRLQGHSFQIVLRLWVASDGRLARYDLVSSSGDENVDRVLKELLDRAPPMREPPPQEMPQPLRLRVTSRLTG